MTFSSPDLPAHDPGECPELLCEGCLAHERHESMVRLELLLFDAEAGDPSGEWIEDQITVDALDVRNVLDLLRSA